MRSVVVLVHGQAEVAAWPLPGCGRLDLAVVAHLARLQLAAHSVGCAIRLRAAPPALERLIDLCGLAEVLPAEVLPGEVRSVEVLGEPEIGEQLGLQEAVQLRDPVA